MIADFWQISYKNLIRIFKAQVTKIGLVVLLFFSLVAQAQISEKIDAEDLIVGKNCYDHLTVEDQEFMQFLGEKTRFLCLNTDKTIIEEFDCNVLTKKTIREEIENYRQKNGTAAKDRILTALRTQVEKQNISEILKIFQNPKIEASFHKYIEAIVRYQKSLLGVLYQDVYVDEPGVNQSSTSIWLKQRTAMFIDLIKSKLNSTSNTRFHENELAARNLLFSGIELNKKIAELELSDEEKKQLQYQVSTLNSLMKDLYNGAKKTLVDEEKVAVLATGGFVSAVLVVISTGSLAPAFLSTIAGGDIVSSIGGSILTGVTSGAGIAGVTRISDMIFHARATANDNGSNFVCELAHRVDVEGDEALEQIWTYAWHGALIGGTIGGALGFVASKHQQIAASLGLSGVLLSTGFVIKDTKLNLDEIEKIDEKVLAAQLKQASGKSTPGEVADAEKLAEQEKAEVYSRLVGDATRIARYSVGSYKAAENLKQAIANAEKISKVRLSLGRKLRSKEKTAIIKVNESGLKGKIEINREQVLKEAGFSPQEIQKII